MLRTINVIRYALKYKIKIQCTLCKEYDLITKDKLTLHHINHNNKDNEYPNLVILCVKCHSFIHQLETSNETLKEIERKDNRLRHR